MDTAGTLFLRARNNHKQVGSEERTVMQIEHQNSRSSGPPYSASQPAAAKNGKVTDSKRKKGRKKKNGKPGGDVFRVQGNTINGGKADKAGVFGFGNKYIGRKKQEDDESTEDESDPSEDEEWAIIYQWFLDHN